MLKLKRAYEPANESDGYRVLVDRLYPRGVPKSKLKVDEWAKELAPSNELRRRFGHDPEKWREFKREYRKELTDPSKTELLASLARRARRSRVTLVYGAKDEEHNNAVVLKELIEVRKR